MGECVFCKKYHEKKEIIYENKYFWSQFDLFPVSPGHAEVIPIRHVVSLEDLSYDEWEWLKSTIISTMGKIETRDLVDLYRYILKNPINEKSKEFCEKMLKHPRINSRPNAYNHGINDGKAAGRTVDHFHWHIIPRYEGDVENPRGGVRGVIPWAMDYK